MRIRGLVLVAVAILVVAILAVDGVLWWLYANAASAEQEKLLLTSATTVLLAAVGVGGTVLGANLSSGYAKAAAQRADRRAMYAQFLSAAAAYQHGRSRSDHAAATLKAAEAKKEALPRVEDRDPAEAQSITARFNAAVNSSTAEAAALKPLTAELLATSAVAQLARSSDLQEGFIQAVVTKLLDGEPAEDEIKKAMEEFRKDLA